MNYAYSFCRYIGIEASVHLCAWSRTSISILICLLMIIATCLSPHASEQHKLAKTQLCAFCGADTFACGSAASSSKHNHMIDATPPHNQNRLSTLHTLNSKVQQVLLKQLQSHGKHGNNSLNCTCIPNEWVCDFTIDCIDASDEVGCDKPTCSTSLNFSCATNAKCISKSLFCNGINNCGDNSDEIDCAPRTCDIEYETRCDNGRCIPSEWLCDGYDDCHDLSDERCVSSISSNNISNINSGTICDNELLNCDALNFDTTLKPINLSSKDTPIACSAGHFMCNNGLCIPESSLCDSENDCGLWEDENNCDSHIKCRNDEFQCQSGQCILMSKYCNGITDCSDGSDEKSCFPRETECSSGNFRCQDGSCVGLAAVCNGAPNCPDGSDESNSTCIPGVSPCHENGLPCQHLCVSTVSGFFCACKHGYRKGSDGRSCIDIDECRVGSLLNHDINDASTPEADAAVTNDRARADAQVCSQSCENSVPGFQCSCVTGYQLASDKRRCKAVHNSKAVLFTARGNHFSAFFLEFTSQFSSVPSSYAQLHQTTRLSDDHTHNVGSTIKPKIFMDFDYQHNLVFWSNPKTRTIHNALVELNSKISLKSERNSSEPLSLLSSAFSFSPSLLSIRFYQTRTIVASGLVQPSGIAIDWVNKRLFFIDAGSSRIEFCNFDGSMRKVLLHRYVEKPNSIVVHPERGSIFWSDWGKPSRIESAFMDGSSRQVIVSSLLSLPTGLVIDYPANRLYWTDTKQSMIECSNFDGSNRFTLVHDRNRHPISLSIFEDHLYYSTANSQSFQVVSKLSGRNITLFTSNNNPEFDQSDFDIDLKVFHPLLQATPDRKQCDAHPCSHICLPTNVSFQCSCPFGYSFETGSEHRCELNSNPLLLFTHRNDIRAMTISSYKHLKLENQQHDFNVAHVLPIVHISFVVSFDFDSLSSTLFWCDLVNKSIGRAKWTFENQQEIIVSNSLVSPSGVAYDWATSNLYFTDSGRNVIEVTETDTPLRSVVIWQTLDQPRDIVLDCVKALMFWSQWSNQSASIERAGMDGSFRVVIHLNNLSRPQSLALDRLQNRLYWTDSSRALIESSQYDGTNRQVIVSQGNGQHPFAITIFNDFVYWSDLQLRNVQRAHKHTGEMQSIIYEDSEGLMDIAIIQQHNRSLALQEFSITTLCQQSRCSHLCLLSPQKPGFQCFCPTGIRLMPDGRTCADDMSKYLVFTTRKAIRRISLEFEHHIDVNINIDQSMENAFVVDVHTTSKTIFWSDTKENIIYSANILSSKAKPVVRFGLLGVNGLAVDQVGNKLYFSDAGRKRIEVINFDGSYRKVLIGKDLDSPRAIAVDHKSGHMVWTDWGAQVRIERAEMDGGRRAILVSEDLGWPNGITITKNGRIVWADSKMHTIEMVDLNGANRKKLAENLPSPYGVAVMDNALYFTDWNTKTIERIDFMTDAEMGNEIFTFPSKPKVFARSLGNLVDIRAIDQQEVFPLLYNMCQVNNGGCSHLCLRNSAPGYSCHCPTGMVLLTDNKTCKSDISKQLLLGCKTNLRRVSLDTRELIDTFLPLGNMLDLVAFDYHFARRQIFFIDAAYRRIHSVSLQENLNLSQLGTTESALSLSISTLISRDLGQPSSVAIDWISDNLYWTDKERRLIEVARLDGSSRKVLLDLDLNNPKCLLVLPHFGVMFWLNAGSEQRIERAFLDGSGRATLVKHDIGLINDVTADRGNENDPLPRLYWTDGIKQKIESIKIDGTERRIVLSKGLTLPFSIAVSDDYVYWSDSYYKMIERVNRWTADDYQLVVENIDALQKILLVSATQQSVLNIASDLNENPCGIDNGACSHLCLFRPHGYICACPSQPDLRPCSTVPGEVVHLPTIIAASVTDSLGRSNFTNFLPTQTMSTPINTNFSQSSIFLDTVKSSLPINDNEIGDILNNDNNNQSVRLKDLREMCRHDLNHTRCDSSRLSLDDRIIQMAYALALILLSVTVLVCAILAFICKRKLMDEETKLSNLNEPSESTNLTPNSLIKNVSNINLHQQHPFMSFPRPLIFKQQALQNRLEQLRFQEDNFHRLPPLPPPPRGLALVSDDIFDYGMTKTRGQASIPSQSLTPTHFSTMNRESHLKGINHLNQMAPVANFKPRAQTLPRNLATMSARDGNCYIYNSAFNSPHLQPKSTDKAHITYLRLESDKLETDI